MPRRGNQAVASAEGKVAVFLARSQKPILTATDPNMHSGYHHYLKLGMYRRPAIATENCLNIRNVSMEPVTAPKEP